MADSPEALFVAFVGTKQRRDYWTLAAIRQQPMWPEDCSEAVSPTQLLAVSGGCLSTSGSFGQLGVSTSACPWQRLPATACLTLLKQQMLLV